MGSRQDLVGVLDEMAVLVRYMVMVDMDAEIEGPSGRPDCRDTRSAVRCLVPVSTVSILRIGHQLNPGTDDSAILPVEMMAPSIFASSRSARSACRAASKAKPPVET